MKILTRLAAASVLALTLGSFTPATIASADYKCYDFKDSEKEFAQKINNSRSNHGVGNLSLDKQLSRVARRHTWEMKDKRTLYHTPSSTLRWRVTNWNRLGENVGYGGDVDSLHQAFMDSPSHRANVLGNYRHVGIGVKKDGDIMWVTIIFEDHMDPGTRMKVCR